MGILSESLSISNVLTEDYHISTVIDRNGAYIYPYPVNSITTVPHNEELIELCNNNILLELIGVSFNNWKIRPYLIKSIYHTVGTCIFSKFECNNNVKFYTINKSNIAHGIIVLGYENNQEIVCTLVTCSNPILTSDIVPMNPRNGGSGFRSPIKYTKTIYDYNYVNGEVNSKIKQSYDYETYNLGIFGNDSIILTPQKLTPQNKEYWSIIGEFIKDYVKWYYNL